MKVLHLNHSDSIGGAANYTRRIHESLCNRGHDSYMCCSSVKLDDPRIFRVNPSMNEYRALLKAKMSQWADQKISLLEKTASHLLAGWVR